VGEADVHGKPGTVLVSPSIDVLQHVAQPGPRPDAIGEPEEEVPPVPHQNGRDDIVLNVVQIVLQIGRRQAPHRHARLHVFNLAARVLTRVPRC
jgi:hypothetical protein